MTVTLLNQEAQIDSGSHCAVVTFIGRAFILTVNWVNLS